MKILLRTNIRSMTIYLKTKILTYENLTKTNFRSMRIFLRAKILSYDNLTKN